MTMKETAQILARARLTGARLAEYPAWTPDSLDEGYRVQNEMIRATGLAVGGWKVGVTSQKAMDMLGLKSPMAGPVFARDIHESPAALALPEDNLRVIEAEICFRMGADLPPRPEPCSRAEAMAAIASAHPAFELVSKRLPGALREAAPWVAADGTMNHALVLGPGRDYAPEMDLVGESVEVAVGGRVETTGQGANTMGDPVAALLWLVNHLGARGRGLRAGDVVATGLLCDVVTGAPGDVITARFSSLGEVALTLT